MRGLVWASRGQSQPAPLDSATQATSKGSAKPEREAESQLAEQGLSVEWARMKRVEDFPFLSRLKPQTWQSRTNTQEATRTRLPRQDVPTVSEGVHLVYSNFVDLHKNIAGPL
ncbi:unnamed protein product [Protopolystoma xenopodis]|uniref:Uncharacterized protein n=1 Tax=Protopolystoma xenopodis TaxID=117903 RepID=A0A3S5A8Q4_9PLAT|nr:unnamed protein product [Protopolystoma xenopodis]